MWVGISWFRRPWRSARSYRLPFGLLLLSFSLCLLKEVQLTWWDRWRWNWIYVSEVSPVGCQIVIAITFHQTSLHTRVEIKIALCFVKRDFRGRKTLPKLRAFAWSLISLAAIRILSNAQTIIEPDRRQPFARQVLFFKRRWDFMVSDSSSSWKPIKGWASCMRAIDAFEKQVSLSP